MGHETDSLSYLAALARAPHDYDFYQTLRRLECLFADQPRWSEALRPGQEPVRFGQEPSMSFAPAPLSAFEPGSDGRPPRLEVRLFGLLGPNGPLPLHLTEFTRDRLRHSGDAALARFLDIFNHRFIELFYRAWAQAQPHVSLDRPDDDRFGTYLGALIGMAPAAQRGRDSVRDFAKLFRAGLLARQIRNADGLVVFLRGFFTVPTAVEQFVPHWLEINVRDRTFLGSACGLLGDGAVLGERVWDRQHKIRIRIGPLSLAEYESFLPGGGNLRQLVDCMRTYLCFEFEWDVCLVLKRGAVPPTRIGRSGRLGWTTWLGRRRSFADADDLQLNAEAMMEHGEAA